jgi:predicted phage baseplate assembly protein
VTDKPILPGRSASELRETIAARAPYYVPEWNPDVDDAGTALASVFSVLAADVVSRLNDVPAKHRVAFVEALGFDRRPPQPARAPLQVELTEGAPGNVSIPAGTESVAGATDTHPAETFEIPRGEGFEATPATLCSAYGIDPQTDQLFDHWPSLRRGEPTPLFAGENQQAHVFYMGHSDLLTLEPGSTVTVRLQTNASKAVLQSCLVWEYYGTAPKSDSDAVADEELPDDWYELEPTTTDSTASDPRRCPLSETGHVERFIERLAPTLSQFGYKLTDHPQRLNALIRGLADDISNGHFDQVGTAHTDDDGPTLPRSLLSRGESRAEVLDLIDAELELLRLELERISVDGLTGGVAAPKASTAPEMGDDIELSFEIPGETTDQPVADIESRWLRCRFPDDMLARALFDISISSASISVGTQDGEEAVTRTPDDAFANDVPLTVDDDGDGGAIYPFGKRPTPSRTFALSSTEVFTKPGATVELIFVTPEQYNVSTGDRRPEVLWEYWNGDSWRRLDVTDSTNALTTDGTVSFDVPTNLKQTAIAGHESRWVRARLIEGDYGRARVEQIDEDTWETVTEHVQPPLFERVSIRYGHNRAFEHIVTQNNCAYTVHTGNDRPFRPFIGLGTTNQTLYLGFDEPLENGPLKLFVPLEAKLYPDSFHPRIKWEYCPDPVRGQWESLDGQDGTEGLRERGIVSLEFPRPTTAFEVAGKTFHWIRARVTEHEFAYSSKTIFERQPIGTEESASTDSFERLSTEQSAPSVTTPPVLSGIHPNTTWVVALESIEDEVLGRSDGTQHQTFEISNTPVIDYEVWVNEAESLSPGERRRLQSESEVATEERRRGTGDLQAFWVQWTAVDDFHTSDEGSRHYQIDRTDGQLTFGDGRSGAIPPAGDRAVKATYTTGDGAAGNVELHAISALRQSIPFVDAVSNPERADGGANAESTDEVVTRAPQSIRDGGRAVAPADYERIARDSTRELAHVQCEPGQNAKGQAAPGWVTLLIVPNAQQPRPTPSTELKQHVHSAVSKYAPASLVDPDNPKLVVRGPSYVEVSTEVRVTPEAVTSISELENRITDRLVAFCHPVTGGPADDTETERAGGGWAFGTLPTPSMFHSALEEVKGVRRVEEITIRFDSVGTTVKIAEGDQLPTAPSEALVCSGRHRVTVNRGAE